MTVTSVARQQYKMKVQLVGADWELTCKTARWPYRARVKHVSKEAVVTRLHARVAALRSEFHHTLAKRLVAEFSAIGVEDLNIAGMTRNRRLDQSLKRRSSASR